MSDKVESRETGGEGPNPPRSWLTPYLLMMLRSWQGYGYELVRQLALFGFGWVDPGTVYRALRELERDGYVMSHWDTSNGSGPARRMYTITDAGIQALGLWATTLDSYRQMLERFFQYYTGITPPSGAAADTSRDRDSSET
jgi:PadR family transcriptional regulator, regulatory protein PadR